MSSKTKVARKAANGARGARLSEVSVDPFLTLAAAQGCVAAYQAFDRQKVVPPANWNLVGRWTGWDAAWFGGSEELFGLLFQSAVPGQLKTFLFAFRGTDSDMDAYEDGFFETTAFVPTNGKVSPTPYVSSGFYGIYDSVGGSMTQSMRQQLFMLLARFRPSRVYITGHSLGAALSQLFALDVAVSSPQLWAMNENFASPMVGTQNWKTVYESQPAEKDSTRRTIRVYNYWDYVPSLPPAAFNYTHVGSGFRTSFYVLREWYPHELARHSILNLQTVLGHAVWQNPQVWVGTFQDATDSANTMQSDVPPSAADIAWVEKAGEFGRFEAALRKKSRG